jgi:hypothetical protein
MLAMKTKRIKNDERGMATLEVLPLLFIFIYIFAYTLGTFGFIHTSIKYSISARAYAFETFRNRTNLTYFRDKPNSAVSNYRQIGNRFHGIQAPGTAANDTFRATSRSIRMGVKTDPLPSDNDPTIHNDRVHYADELSDGRRNRQVEVNPGWVMVVYGICLNKSCGD